TICSVESKQTKMSSQYAHLGLFIPLMIYPGFKRGAGAGVAKPTVLSLLWGSVTPNLEAINGQEQSGRCGL
uniref:Translocase of outer membrane 7 kDa subunit homolog n=1 Tax=Catagonus wagneri TaxID=51154 RepID=A0A8C3VQ98_9CETA